MRFELKRGEMSSRFCNSGGRGGQTVPIINVNVFMFNLGSFYPFCILLRMPLSCPSANKLAVCTNVSEKPQDKRSFCEFLQIYARYI